MGQLVETVSMAKTVVTAPKASQVLRANPARMARMVSLGPPARMANPARMAVMAKMEI
jgi:hypothetical protein